MMEAIKIKRDSWHYKIVSIAKDYPNDICDYIRAFFIGTAVLFIGLVLILFVLVILTHTLIGFVFALFYGVDILSEKFIIGLMTIGVLTTYFGTLSLFSWVTNRRRLVKSDPGPVTQAYQAWKGKYCARVEIS